MSLSGVGVLTSSFPTQRISCLILTVRPQIWSLVFPAECLFVLAPWAPCHSLPLQDSKKGRLGGNFNFAVWYLSKNNFKIKGKKMSGRESRCCYLYIIMMFLDYDAPWHDGIFLIRHAFCQMCSAAILCQMSCHCVVQYPLSACSRV